MSEPQVTGDWSEPAGDACANWPTLPGYEILGELGRGGMGVVYKARQVGWNRLVALKMIRDGALAGPQERARFFIEAEAAARMRHPNIVETYEVGQHGGLPYFAMEFIEGGSLHKFVGAEPRAAAEAAALIRTLAHAVQHAHEQKIIHRDLKPANILLKKVASSQESVVSRKESAITSSTTDYCLLTTDYSPKITDFGLAKRLDSESTAITQDGSIIGTASYMAPEQAAGRVGEIGPTVDVYALGAILYELLTGRPPFRADTWNETIQQVLRDDPVPPTRLMSDVPRDLETICLKCLEKLPRRRYATASQLADDLSRFLESKPVTAVPVDNRERLSRVAARDGYQIVNEIGTGPRSAVYHAMTEPLKQPVALKVFREGICTHEEWQDRLHRGADLWTVLAHPQFVPIQRAGWWDASPYVALELCPLGSLAGKLAGKPQPLREALRLVAQLAELIGYIHRQGLVHGNLKPSNVLFAADGIPRIVDFRLTGGLFLDRARANDKANVGLAYLAPELVNDPGAEPRVHTDIYGLGIILYEMLTGRPPFAGASAPETFEQVREHDPVPPSSLNSEVTAKLDAVCLKCLRKNPWQRYNRAYDLATRLRHFLEESGNRTRIRR